MQQIAEWLEKLGMSEYAERFTENGINVAALRHLTDQDLKDIGVLLGHRRIMLAAIGDLTGAPPAVPKPVAAAEPKAHDAAERRQVTVMFSDLVGSTALAGRMDPEDLREVISAYQKCVAETVQRFGGFVAKYMGDGVLIYFGYPQAHEDDAERAVRAGLQLIAAVSELKATSPLQTRVGIATGLVVVGELIGSGEAQERGIIGETPLISGEPGIGKSRIAEALYERISTEPHTRIRFFCSPHHQDSALYPAIAQLERAAGLRRDDTGEQRLEKLEAVLLQATNDISEIAPLLADLLSIPTGSRYPIVELTPQKRKEKTLEALVAQAERLSAGEPVLMVFEDVHWSDPTTRESLDLLIDRVSTLRTLIIITFRPEFTPPWIGRPHVTLVSLSRLSRRQRAAMITGVTGGIEPCEGIGWIAKIESLGFAARSSVGRIFPGAGQAPHKRCRSRLRAPGPAAGGPLQGGWSSGQAKLSESNPQSTAR